MQPNASAVPRVSSSEVDTAQYNRLREELHPVPNRFRLIGVSSVLFTTGCFTQSSSNEQCFSLEMKVVIFRFCVCACMCLCGNKQCSLLNTVKDGKEFHNATE